MIVELMRAAGPDLVRRWVSALLLAPEDERDEIVRSIEERMAELYVDAEPAGKLEVKVSERKAKSSAG